MATVVERPIKQITPEKEAGAEYGWRDATLLPASEELAGLVRSIDNSAAIEGHTPGRVNEQTLSDLSESLSSLTQRIQMARHAVKSGR